jgi:dTDP-4-amino-4,6-dideoxygalactose transaminase
VATATLEKPAVMNVPLVELKSMHQPIWADLIRAVTQTLEAHSFILGPAVTAFENEAAAYLGVKHAIGCSNGSDALYIALRALGVGPGDEVVTTPFTYVATPESIWRTGAKIVFCDIDPLSYCLSPDALKKVITPRTKAIMPVHLFGQCADMDAIKAVAGKIPVVEDAAQSWGASYKGKKSGALGTIACYSFYPTKTLGAFGDGGLISTDDDNLAKLVRALRVHGELGKRYHNELHGMNSRLDSVQAAILSVKLRHVDAWNDERVHIANYYGKRFANGPVKMARVAPNNHHVWHQCCIEAPNRDQLMAFLKERGVGSGIYYPVAQHEQPCYADLGYKHGDFPVTEWLCGVTLSLPCWPGMSAAQQAHVADSVLAFYDR